MSDAVSVIPRFTRTTEGFVLHTESPAFLATEDGEVISWLEEPRFFEGEKEGLRRDLQQWVRRHPRG